MEVQPYLNKLCELFGLEVERQESTLQEALDLRGPGESFVFAVKGQIFPDSHSVEMTMSWVKEKISIKRSASIEDPRQRNFFNAGKPRRGSCPACQRENRDLTQRIESDITTVWVCQSCFDHWNQAIAKKTAEEAFKEIFGLPAPPKELPEPPELQEDGVYYEEGGRPQLTPEKQERKTGRKWRCKGNCHKLHDANDPQFVKIDSGVGPYCFECYRSLGQKSEEKGHNEDRASL